MLIVVELGGEWPSWLADSFGGTRKVCSEEPEETPAAFAARISEAIRSAEGLQAAVLLCNERADPAQIQARRGTVAALAAALVSGNANKLFIGAPARSGERLRASLGAIADEVGRARSSARRVVVTFGGDDPAGAGAVSRVA